MARRLFIVGCAALLATAGRSFADGASAEDCRQFHEECQAAKAEGYHDAGICNVERLECPPAAPDAATNGAARTRRPAPVPGHDPERGVGP